MAGLVPAIHVLDTEKEILKKKDVDARDPGYAKASPGF
jgi:hypothetical protein